MLKDCAVTKTGRRNYHGKHELIASNHMEILVSAPLQDWLL